MKLARPDRYEPQKLIGPYRLLSRVVTSQDCEIWEAAREPLGGRHAVKVMLPARRGDRRQIGLLKREFSVARRLSHPGIIRIDDFGVERGIGYLAMEYFPAPNLKQLIREGGERLAALSPRIVEEAAEALGYLHSRGWIHRDVKPENFLVGSEGHVKLIDFSLARRIHRWWDRLLLASPKVEGTRSYMSPEQIRRGRQDQRADIYSLGCVFFELSSGKPPFTGENANALLTKHLRSAPPSLKAANPQVSDRFAALVRGMLSKEPRQRPASLHDVLRELRNSSIFERAPSGT